MQGDLDEEEYEETRNETLKQINEFNAYLNKMASGDISLIDDVGKAQLAIQSAIKSAFKSSEIAAMMGKKENSAVRGRLAATEESFRLGRINEATFAAQKRELLKSLDMLGDALSDTERSFLMQVVA